MKKLLMFSLFCCSLSPLYSLPSLGNPFSVEFALFNLIHQKIDGICNNDLHRLIRAAITEVHKAPIDSSIQDPQVQLGWRFAATLIRLEGEAKKIREELSALNDIPSERIARRPSTSSTQKDNKLLNLQENELLRRIIATAAIQSKKS
jgi:hypothetical protein